MTVSATTVRKTYAGDNVTTSFSTSPIVFYDSGDLVVYVIVTATGAATLLTKDTHYTVTGGNNAVGTINLAGGGNPHGALASTDTLLIARVIPLTQPVNLQNYDANDAEVAEEAYDRLTLQIQDLDSKVSRCVMLPISDVSGATTELPAPAASQYLRWNSGGTALENAEIVVLNSVIPTAYMLTLLDDSDAATARTTLGLGTMAVAATSDYVAKAAYATTGDILIATAAGTPTALSAGTSGYILTSNGAGVAPSWQVAPATAWTTGDVKLTLKTTADSGWVLMDDGTIGDASSSASTRANADTEDLFTLLWNNTADADCPVSGGRGASAAADFAAHKRITLPLALGRALAVYGAGSGLTSRTLAKTTGEETHVLSSAELASHTHTGPSHTHTATTDNESAHTHGAGSYSVNSSPGIQTFTSGAVVAATLTVPSAASVTGTSAAGSAHNHTLTTAASGTGATGSAGSGTAHNNMQPTVFLNVMIKL